MKLEKWQMVISGGLLLMVSAPIIALICKYYFGIEAISWLPLVAGGGGLCFFGLILSL
jgi:hypothetical protein